MAAIEGTYKSLIQGVSQQVVRLRLDGQCEVQKNMLADPVTSLRRRGGTPLIAALSLGNMTGNNLFTAHIERGDTSAHLCINTDTGDYYIFDANFTTQLNTGNDPYFIASKGRNSIQITSVNLDTFIVNTEQAPAGVPDTRTFNPNTGGFFFIKTTAFSKEYAVTLRTGVVTYTATYTTPSGVNPGDAALSTTEYIATVLRNQIVTYVSPITVTVAGAYVGISSGVNVSISTNSGSIYITASNNGIIPSVIDLPPNLPDTMDGYIVGVGADANFLVYYRWEAATKSWKEDSAFGSFRAITNMPRVLKSDNTIIARNFEGRLAGDDSTNTLPTFLKEQNISGITTYQGRLALLSGAFISMSSSTNPLRFFRKTVTTLEPDDRIDVGIGSAQNTVLRRGIQFNRDLIVFGNSVQAVVSTGSGVLTPSNAAVSVTSEMSCNSKIEPFQIGQTVLYAFNRNSEYSGFLELIPSQYSASQYISQDATQHLPEYFSGDIRFTSSSNVVNMSVVGGEDLNKLYIYEYLWSADGKQQNAWGEWEFSYPIVSAYFAGASLIIMQFDTGTGKTCITRVDPRTGYTEASTQKVPYLDLHSKVTVTSGEFIVPNILRYAIQHNQAKLALVASTGTYASEEVGQTINPNTWGGKVVYGVPDGEYWVGLKFKSVFGPSPVLLKDQNNKELGVGKVRLVRLTVALYRAGVIQVNIRDNKTDTNFTFDVTGVMMNSPELEPDYPLKIKASNIIVPCRTLSDTTYVTFKCDSTHDMNLVDISYLLKYNERYRRV